MPPITSLNMLKSLTVFVFTLWLTGSCVGQEKTSSDRATFADMRWGLPVAEVRQALTSKGFKVKPADDGDLEFEGTLLDTPFVGFVLIARGTLSKVTVTLATRDQDARGSMMI